MEAEKLHEMRQNSLQEPRKSANQFNQGSKAGWKAVEAASSGASKGVSSPSKKWG